MGKYILRTQSKEEKRRKKKNRRRKKEKRKNKAAKDKVRTNYLSFGRIFGRGYVPDGGRAVGLRFDREEGLKSAKCGYASATNSGQPKVKFNPRNNRISLFDPTNIVHRIYTTKIYF